MVPPIDINKESFMSMVLLQFWTVEASLHCPLLPERYNTRPTERNLCHFRRRTVGITKQSYLGNVLGKFRIKFLLCSQTLPVN